MLKVKTKRSATQTHFLFVNSHFATCCSFSSSLLSLLSTSTIEVVHGNFIFNALSIRLYEHENFTILFLSSLFWISGVVNSVNSISFSPNFLSQQRHLCLKRVKSKSCFWDSKLRRKLVKFPRIRLFEWNFLFGGFPTNRLIRTKYE